MARKVSAAAARTAVVIASVVAAGCATAGRAPDRAQVGEAVRARTGQALKPGGGPPLPDGVSIEDGLTRDEAVAVALWNSPAFQATLADLGIARADLAEAGLLRNPILSLLFPVGPKQLEWTLQYPLEALWQRPRRVAAATLNVQAVSERLVWQALSLVAEVKTAHTEALAAEQRVALAVENAKLARGVADISDARLRAGDISELEARAPRSDFARLDALRRALEHDRDVARIALVALLGIDTPPDSLRLTPPASETESAGCDSQEVLTKDALASRPDVRAAEIGIESAAQRAKWERSRVFTLMAILDGNGRGTEGAEVGPGVNAEIPLFARNQGGIARADAEVERAGKAYAALRSQVLADVRTASARVRQAEQAAESWRKDIVPELQTEQRQAESAYRAGEAALLSLLDTGRRLVEGRTRELEAVVALDKARVALERSVGRRCGS